MQTKDRNGLKETPLVKDMVITSRNLLIGAYISVGCV